MCVIVALNYVLVCIGHTLYCLPWYDVGSLVNKRFCFMENDMVTNTLGMHKINIRKECQQ